MAVSNLKKISEFINPEDVQDFIMPKIKLIAQDSDTSLRSMIA